MELKKLHIVFILMLIFYLTRVTPYCSPLEVSELTEQEPDASYTQEQQYSIREIVSNAGYVFVTSFGESMLPNIKSNERCICIKKDEYEVNDIVMYIRSDDVAVAHRIVFEEGDIILVKGDNNDFIDSRINKDQIVCSIPEVPKWKKLLM